MTKLAKYDESNIERYAGLIGIRKKSTVYIGPNDSNGLWTILREPADNAVDLALKGHNNKVHIVFDPDNKNRYWVIDNGPGFPVKHKEFEDERGRKEKLSTFYVATGLTHAGSNFDSDEASRGTHGIGIKATNAMSKLLKVYTFRDGSWHTILYKDAKLKEDVSKSKAPKLPHGVKVTKGTVVCFEPDLSLFTKGSKIELADVLAWCELTSYLVPNIEVKVTTRSGKTKVYKTKGISEYIDKKLTETKSEKMGKIFVHHDKFVDIGLAFANAENPSVNAYTNGLLNVDGGEHVKAVYDALAKSLKPYNGKSKKPEYKPADLRDGVVGLINAKVAAPKFSNQRKDALLDDRVYKPCYEGALAAFTEFFKANKKLAQEIIRRASLLRKKTSDFLNDKKLIKNVKGAVRGLSAKFADINTSKTPIEDRELYLVEGDSAGGTSKIARHKSFQATFALRGKPLNVMEAPKDKINANKEIAGIFAGIGLGMDGSKDKSAIKFGKIIFLADPDVDGRHINCLLLTLFWKYLPHLFKEGKIYMLLSPEYYGKYKGKTYFGDKPEAVYKQAGSKNVVVRHIKGWGELNAGDMQPIAFDVETRKLIKILPPKDSKGVKRFEALMGKSPAYRQELLGVVE